MSYNAYRKVQAANAVSNSRDTEYRLLAQVTGGLLRAKEGRSDLQERLNAILRNEKVWMAFLEDLNDPGNRLPRDLKGNLASLAMFVIKETKLVLDTDAPLDDLININRQIMAGLKPQPEALAG